MSIIQEQRDANKAHRLKHAADPNDGLTIKYGDGTVAVVSKSMADYLIQIGAAVSAE